jgi:hypothetical protein
MIFSACPISISSSASGSSKGGETLCRSLRNAAFDVLQLLAGLLAGGVKRLHFCRRDPRIGRRITVRWVRMTARPTATPADTPMPVDVPQLFSKPAFNGGRGFDGVGSSTPSAEMIAERRPRREQQNAMMPCHP